VSAQQPPPIHRAPPHDVEAEQGLLGSIVISPATIDNCSDRVTVEHFFIPAHQVIFSALARMRENNKAIDLITLTNFLRDDGQLENVGGAAYVTSLFSFVPTAANAEYYIDIIRRKYLRRRIIAISTELVRQSYEETTIDEHELLDVAQSEITGLAIESDRQDALKHVKDGAYVVLERFEEAFHHRGQQAIHGLATGIIDFDRMTAGLQPQQFIVIGARPSQGKTALAMNLAANMALKMIPVAVFSMEMSYDEIIERLVCSVAQVSLKVVRLTGFMSKEKFASMPDEACKVGNAPMWIDDSPSLTIAAFKARARRAKVQLGVKVIFVDYLQLMRSPSKRSEFSRVIEITEISAALKGIAKELKIPVIVCAQLNREAEGREFGKPKLSDLRESGSIEQDADIVALLWRPERHLENYNQRKKLARALKLKLPAEDDDPEVELWGDELSPDQLSERDRMINEYAELIVAKQRNGPVGEIKLRFESDITKFQNVTQRSWSNRTDQRQSVAGDT
jgi:replicative DNA helicase